MNLFFKIVHRCFLYLAAQHSMQGSSADAFPTTRTQVPCDLALSAPTSHTVNTNVTTSRNMSTNDDDDEILFDSQQPMYSSSQVEEINYVLVTQKETCFYSASVGVVVDGSCVESVIINILFNVLLCTCRIAHR